MIGIIGAMDSEVAALVAAMSAKETQEYNNYKFYKGTLFGKEVVIVKCGIGKVNAAVCTQILLSNFNIEKVINTGIAGAVGTGLKQYDFVASTNVVHHDVDVQIFGYKPGQVPGMPETFAADEKLADAAVSAFNKSALAKEHKITKGLVASGDQFIAGGEKKDFIVSTFKPQCVEMEGASIAQVCYINKTPFAIIRCMSDCADDSASEEYSEEAASKLSSAFLMEVIKEI